MPEDNDVRLLVDILPAKVLDLRDVEIPTHLADYFSALGEGTTRFFYESPKRFLDALLTEESAKITEMVSRIGAVLSSDDDIDTPIPNPVIGVADRLIPDGVRGEAWNEAAQWLSEHVKWGWVDDSEKRPEGTDQGEPLGFFRASLELTRRYLVDGHDPSDEARIGVFLEDYGWVGWEVYLTSIKEDVRLYEILGRRVDEGRSEFLQRILEHTVRQAITQMCSNPDLDFRPGLDLQDLAGTPSEEKSARSGGSPPGEDAELLLVRRMFGESASSLSREQGHGSDRGSIQRKIASAALRLGFIVEHNVEKQAWLDRVMKSGVPRG